MTAHLLRLTACLVAVGLLIATGKEADAGKKVPAINYSDAIHKLVLAHNQLALAKHDYKGHRANAGTEINRAISSLGGTSKGEISSGNNPKESQATSDKHLFAAGQMLGAIQTELAFIHSKTNDPRANNAGKHVAAAMNQISIALKIK